MSDDTKQKVREHAYRLWEEAGRPEGEHEHHWKRAEEEAHRHHQGGRNLDSAKPRRGGYESSGREGKAGQSRGAARNRPAEMTAARRAI